MPLIHSSSDKALHENMKTLMSDIGKSPHVKSRAQAVAIALETQRRAGRAMGGVVGYDMGGAVPEVIQALQAGTGTLDLMQRSPALSGMVNPQMPTQPGMSMPNANPITASLMARGGVANLATGGFNVGKTANLTSPWQERAEDRRLHVGPILSNVPGRTDNHMGKVPSGSYVIPADIVSGRGQGNTIAGAHALQQMFKMGPYGSSPGRISHGSGAPRPPRPPHFAMGGIADQGGARGEGDDDLVPVNLAGGEIVVPPENLRAVVHPNLDEAHRIMDAWVLHERKQLRNTLAKLPGPAKD